jgi:hypothetical protein
MDTGPGSPILRRAEKLDPFSHQVLCSMTFRSRFLWYFKERDGGRRIVNMTGDGLFLLKDFHKYLDQDVIVRKLRDLTQEFRL